MLKNALEKKGHTVYIVTVNNEDLHFKYKEDEKIIHNFVSQNEYKDILLDNEKDSLYGMPGHACLFGL